MKLLKFLSTLPTRGVTQARMRPLSCGENFYPRSPRGERHQILKKYHNAKNISIHAPREGSD